MAQTGYTPILIYSSSTTSNTPSASNLTNSTLGSELAINITDGKLFYKDNANAVQVIGWKTTPTTAGGTGLTSYTAGDLLYYASGTTLSKLAIGTSGQWLGSSGTAPQWNSPAALTKTDDTNVTLTLGGSASTALLNAASLTLGWTGQLAVTRGGTGLSSVAQGDILYGSAANTLSALAKNTTATRYLSNTGTSNNPAWAQVDLTNGVTGTLPVGNGGSGTSTAFTAGSIVFAGASGIYSQNNSQLFWDNTNNRLGIGTASPSYPLDCHPKARIGYNVSNAAPGSTDILATAKVMMNGAGGDYLTVGQYSSSIMWIQAAYVDPSLAKYDIAMQPLGGNVYIGYATSNGSYKLQVNSQIFATSSTIATSDGRYKENIVPLSNVLDDVCALNPVQFSWKKHPIHDFDTQTPTVGFIAQEVQQTLANRPYLNSIVKRNECVLEAAEYDDEKNIIKPAKTEEFFGIAEGNMIALLTAAIQELTARVKKLESK